MNVKVCGMTREDDVEQALSLGADYIGFIVYPKSLRALTLERAVALSAPVPKEKRVIVDVQTDPADLKRYEAAGFGRFQIHINPATEQQIVAGYADCVGRDRLWLAPRLAPSDVFPEWMLDYASTILLDTYSKDRIGGTGHTGDFGRFAKLKAQFPGTTWVLAGGLNASNLANAVKESTASVVDVNSGLERSPGVKDPEKLRDFFQVALNVESQFQSGNAEH